MAPRVRMLRCQVPQIALKKLTRVDHLLPQATELEKYNCFGLSDQSISLTGLIVTLNAGSVTAIIIALSFSSSFWLRVSRPPICAVKVSKVSRRNRHSVNSTVSRSNRGDR